MGFVCDFCNWEYESEPFYDQSGRQLCLGCYRSNRSPVSLAICDELSPEAVAAIVYVCSNSYDDPTVDDTTNKQYRWFVDELSAALGGWGEVQRIAKGLGMNKKEKT